MLKVHDVLRNYDFFSDVKILETDYAGNDDELYSGSCYSCPWGIADMIVNSTSDGEGMFVDIDEETEKPYLGIYVREMED